MLPQQNRLPAVTRLRQPRFRKTLLFSVKFSQNNLPLNRFGFVVRKTVDKRAVIRNRIRRVFRSCLEEQLGNIVVGQDMLFFLEKGIIETSRAQLCQKVNQFLTEEKLLK